jgi:hypothetical protein
MFTHAANRASTRRRAIVRANSPGGAVTNTMIASSGEFVVDITAPVTHQQTAWSYHE